MTYNSYVFVPTVNKKETFPRLGRFLQTASGKCAFYSCVGEKQYFSITHLNKYCMSRSASDWDAEPWVSVKIREKGIYKITYERGGLKNLLFGNNAYNQGYYEDVYDRYDRFFCRGDHAGFLPGKQVDWEQWSYGLRDALMCCSKENWKHFIVSAGWSLSVYDSISIPKGEVTTLEELEEKRHGESNYFFSSGEKELCFYYTGRQYDGPDHPPDFAEGEVVYSIQRVGVSCGTNAADEEFE